MKALGAGSKEVNRQKFHRKNLKEIRGNEVKELTISGNHRFRELKEYNKSLENNNSIEKLNIKFTNTNIKKTEQIIHILKSCMSIKIVEVHYLSNIFKTITADKFGDLWEEYITAIQKYTKASVIILINQMVHIYQNHNLIQFLYMRLEDIIYILFIK